MPKVSRDIPRPLRRRVYVEAGHRCAIPTCRGTSGLEVHHITPWARVKEHEFDNLILLCAVCHRRANDKDIDRKAMKAYKANLSLLNSRYGDLERRVIEKFVNDVDLREVVIDRSHAVLLDYLVIDGLLVEEGPAEGAVMFQTEAGDGPGPAGYMGPSRWLLTPEGEAFVTRLRGATKVQ
ncbi:HNH endonuclease [Cellulosimicrobium cellulans]|uniref:HNH endonuclease n=1 Tax=Cellulosimicrobium cellulans TaxID=1710 RepID=UPI001963BA63|nr:HNH endonuclease signature motif containing protein [Cellulosimicrobium cellulans]MBN0039347.1 HNH endonuclease [Cellulosimicrobium cellulans]